MHCEAGEELHKVMHSRSILDALLVAAVRLRSTSGEKIFKAYCT